MDAVVQLRELFSFHNTAQIENALTISQGSVDQAAEILLQQQPATPQQPAVATCSSKKSAQHTKQPVRASQTRHGRSTSAKPSWGSLRETQPATTAAAAASSIGSSSSSSSTLSPQYINPRGRLTPPPPPQMTDQVFPALQPDANKRSSSSSSSSRDRNSNHQQSNRTDLILPQVKQQQQQQHFYKVTATAAAAAPAGPLEDTDDAEDNFRDLSSNPAAAVTVHKPRQQQQIGRRRSVSAQSFAELVKQQQQQQRPSPTAACRQPSPLVCSRPASAAAAAAAASSATHRQDTVCDNQLRQQQQPGFEQLIGQLSALHPSRDTQASNADMIHAEQPRVISSLVSRQDRKEQQHHQQQQEVQLHEQQDTEQPMNPSGHDVYHVLRKEAIQLTNKWQKKLKRAAAAAAAGDYLSAKQLSSEARALKAAADEAHAAAALKIEVANNINSNAGLWELDLHGLHVKEALRALKDRLELLHDLVRDILQQQQQPPAAAAARTSESLHMPSGSPTGNKSHIVPSTAAAAAAAAGSSRQQLLGQLLLLDDQQGVPLPIRQAAARQELRVIVGKGNNSSNGEASLPRVVLQWLTENRFKYVLRSGAVDVKLKRLGQICA